MFAKLRKNNKIDSGGKNPPWADPNAQPPPIPASYSSFSPPTAHKPANKQGNVTDLDITPRHMQMHATHPSSISQPVYKSFDNQNGDGDKKGKTEVVEPIPWRSPPSKKKTNKENSNIAANVITSEQNQCVTETQIHNLEMNSRQKTFEERSIGNTHTENTASQSNRNLSLGFNDQNGTQSNYDSISTVSYSSFGESYSERSEETFESKEFSSEMVTVNETEISNISQAQVGVSPNLSQPPPPSNPWRKTTETSAKNHTTAHKAHLKHEEGYVSKTLESNEVPCSDSTLTPRQLTKSQQNHSQSLNEPQENIHSIHQEEQQQKQPNLGEKKSQTPLKNPQKQPQQPQQQGVPWRSPNLKKKGLSNTQSPAFHHIKHNTASKSQQGVTDKHSLQSLSKDALASSSKEIQIDLTELKNSSVISSDIVIKDIDKTNSTQHCDTSAQIHGIKEDKQGFLSTQDLSPHQTISPIEPLIDSRSSTGKQDHSFVSSNAKNRPETHHIEIKSEITKHFDQIEISSPNQANTISPPPPPVVSPSGQTVATAEEEPILPPPPTNLLEMKEEPVTSLPQSHPLNGSLLQGHVEVQSEIEEGLKSPGYEQEPVTSRIQLFERQATLETEKKKKEEHNPPVKPVAPWVKKTSAGPVQSEDWNLSFLEDCSLIPPPPQEVRKEPPNSELSRTSEPAKTQPCPSTSAPRRHERGDTMPLRSAPPCEVEITHSNQPRNQQDTSVFKHKQLQVVSRERPRTNSMGDYSHTYTENDVLKMPAHAEDERGSGPSVNTAQTPDQTDEAVFDPYCDPNHPKVIQFQDISAAAFKIKSGIMNTPCTRSIISNNLGIEIFFKKEFNQYTGSFKERGARYTLLCLNEEQRSKGVIAASAGNHALALCYHGQDLGIPITVVMPLVAPIMKVQACRQFGANILVKGADIGECREIALRMAKEQGFIYINGYDHPHILAGQGTMGLEIVEQVKGIDAVIVPVGGGGLIAGIALAVKSLYPNVKVIGVESERCASFTAAMTAKKPVYVKAEPTLADGLAVPKVGVNAYALASRLIDKMVVVKEEWIAIAILRLVEMEKAVVEGAGAAGLAALLANELPELKGKRVVIPLCGGNIDTTILGRCLERGLAADGRLIKFTVTVSDRPGGIADLTRLLANLGVSIKDMLHERAWIKSDIFSVAVKVVCETRDLEQMLELKAALEAKYKYLRFPLPEQASKG